MIELSKNKGAMGMRSFGLIFAFQFLSLVAWANPNYTCDVGYVKAGTAEFIKSEVVIIDYQGFSEICKSGKCVKKDYLLGGKVGDSQIIALISHREPGNNTSTMIVGFTLGADGDYTQTSLAGTDFGNRLYTLVSTLNPNVNLSVSCLFHP